MTQFFSLFHKSAFQLLGASPQPPESFWAERLFGTLGFFLDDLGSFYPYVFALSCQTSPHVVIFLQALFTVVYSGVELTHFEVILKVFSAYFLLVL